MNLNTDHSSAGIFRLSLLISMFYFSDTQSSDGFFKSNRLDIRTSVNPVPWGEEVVLECYSKIDDEQFDATWLLEGGLLHAERDQVISRNLLTILEFKKSHVGTYTCLRGDTVSEEVFLDYMFLTPFVDVNVEMTVSLGNSFALTCETNVKDIVFRWEKDGKELEIHKQDLDQVMRTNTAGNYSCSISDGRQASAPSEPLVMDFAVPQPFVMSGDLKPMLGSTFQMKCENSYTEDTVETFAAWSLNNGDLGMTTHDVIMVGHTLNISNFQLSDHGSYRCMDIVGEKSSAWSKPIKIGFTVPEPRVVLDPPDDTPILGSHIEVACISDVVGRIHKYHWSKNNILLSWQESPLNIHMTKDHAGVYSCRIVIEEVSSDWSPDVQIDYDLPKPVIESEPAVHILGNMVVLNCGTQHGQTIDQSHHPVQVKWLKNGNYLDTITNTNYTFSDTRLMITEFKVLHSGSYECEWIMESKVSKSDVFDVPFAVPTPNVTSDKTHVLLGDAVTISCLVNEDDGGDIVWSKELLPLVSATDISFREERNNLVIDQFRPEHEGSYQCQQRVLDTLSPVSASHLISFTIPTPVVETDLPAGPIMLGSVVTLLCQTSLTLPDVEWRISSKDTGIHTLSINLLMMAQDAGIYNCRISVQSVWSEWSHDFNMTYEVPPPQITRDQDDYFLGTPANLKCLKEYNHVEPDRQVVWYHGDHVVIEDGTYRHFDDSTLHLLTLRPQDAGFYTCVYKVRGVDSGKSSMLPINFKVPEPVITANASTIMLGSRASISCIGIFLEENKARDTEWLHHDKELHPSVGGEFEKDGNALIFTNFQEHYKGTYRCVDIIDGVHSDKSEGFQLNFSVPEPFIMSDKAPVAIKDRVNISCISRLVTGDQSPDITWIKDDRLLNETEKHHGIQKHSLIIKRFRPRFAGSYQCVQNVGFISSAKSDTLFIDFVVPTPELQVNPPEGSHELGMPFDLLCHTIFKQIQKTDWSINGIHIITSRTTTFNNITMTPLDAGVYSCRISKSDVWSEWSEALNITFHVPKPTIESNDDIVPVGETVELNCQHAYADNYSESDTSWFKDGERIASDEHRLLQKDSLKIKSILPKDKGVYQCLHRVNGILSPKSESLLVIVEVHPPWIEASNTSFHLGDSFWLECHSIHVKRNAKSKFLWFKDGQQIHNSYGFVVIDNGHLFSNNSQSRLRGSYTCQEFISDVPSNFSAEVIISLVVPRPKLVVYDAKGEVCKTEVDPQGIAKIVFPLGANFSFECLHQFDSNHRPTNEAHIVSEIFEKNGALFSNKWFSLHNKMTPWMQGVFTCRSKVDQQVSEKSEEIIIDFTVPQPSVVSKNTSAGQGEVIGLNCSRGYRIYASKSVTTWFKDGEVLDVNTSSYRVKDSFLEIHNFQSNFSGKYRCQESVKGVISHPSEDFYIGFQGPSEEIGNNSFIDEIVTWIPPLITSTSQSTVPEKSNIKLTCEYENAYTESFHWYKDGEPLTSSNESRITIKGFNKRNNGNYSCGIFRFQSIWKSGSISLVTVDANAICTCPCNNASKNVVLNETEIDEVVTSIQKNLSVDTSSLSAKVRKKTSQADDRPGSIGAGSIAVAFLIFVPTLIISTDCINLVAFITSCIRNAQLANMTV